MNEISPILTATSVDDVLTHVKNSGSSFLLGMMSLAPARREGMFALYAFCRVVDDIADSHWDKTKRLAELAVWRGYVENLFAGTIQHPVMEALQEPVHEYGILKEDLLAIIDGMEMDAREPIQRPTWGELDTYCDHVASAVGRVSVCIFGENSAAGRETAYHLGRALQLTNILRDIDEDAARDRLYLPQEALEEAGIMAKSIPEILIHPALDLACRAIARQAAYHFDEADFAMDKCNRKAIKPARLMRDYYAPLLRDMLKIGWDVPRLRVSLGPVAKIKLLLKSLFT